MSLRLRCIVEENGWVGTITIVRVLNFANVLRKLGTDTLDAVTNILFICSQNRLRSPTAEQIFSRWTRINVSSAGTNRDAENPVTLELIQWADVIIAMERTHKNKLQKKFRPSLNGKNIICLGIPDEYGYMDPELVKILEVKVPRYLPLGSAPMNSIAS